VARLHGGELMLADNAPGLKSIIALPRATPLQKRDDAAVEAQGGQGAGQLGDHGGGHGGEQRTAEVGGHDGTQGPHKDRAEVGA
jgi:hypothetical protein